MLSFGTANWEIACYTKVDNSWGLFVVATLLISIVLAGIPGLTLPLASRGCLLMLRLSPVGGVVVEGLIIYGPLLCILANGCPKLWLNALTCDWFKFVWYGWDVILWKELWCCWVVSCCKASSLTAFVFSFCHINTLCTIAHPQNMIPNPMKTLVTIAGVEWNWMKVYSIIPEKCIHYCWFR